MDTLLHIVQTINFYLSDYILVFLLVGTGLFFSIRTRFVQVRCFGEGMRRVFGNFSMRGGAQKGGLSSFQALTTAIAAQVGTGNIVGACGAILVGGPGAIFWMWIIAFFGMSTIYAEAVLAQKTRVVNPDGTVAGGPVYYIKKAFNNNIGEYIAGIQNGELEKVLQKYSGETMQKQVKEEPRQAQTLTEDAIKQLVAETIKNNVNNGGNDNV